MSKRRPRQNTAAGRAVSGNGSRPAAPDAPRALLSGEAARRVLLVVLAAAFVLSAAFALTVPLGENPDEKDHLNYVRLLVEQRGFVRFVEGDPARYQTHQPPLYYVTAALVYAATGGSVTALRFINVLLHLLTVLVAFRAGRDLFPDRPEIAVGTAAFVAFLPIQAQLAGAITNDPLTTLICAALFGHLLGIARGAVTVRNAVILCLLLGVGLLTKLSVLQLVPALLLAFALAARGRAISLPRAAALAALVLVIGIALASPWLVRNTLLYGDPLTLAIYPKTGPNFTPAQMMQMTGWTFGDYVRNVVVRSFATFWFFLPPNVLRPGPGPFVLVLALALVGLLGALRWLRDREGSPEQRTGVVLCLAGVLLLIPFFARFVLTLFQAQGRYFLPALLPVALLAALGGATLAGRSRLAGAVAVAVVLLLMTLYALSGGGFA